MKNLFIMKCAKVKIQKQFPANNLEINPHSSSSITCYTCFIIDFTSFFQFHFKLYLYLILFYVSISFVV